MEDIEADLKEARGQVRLWIGHKISRTFLTGANPFVLKASRLIEISDLIRKYFPTNQSIGCFSRITDITSKTDEELLQLKNAGYDGLTIGIETGDDEALAFMHKGYASNAIPIQGILPGDTKKVISVLERIISSVDESELQNYRKNLRHL